MLRYGTCHCISHLCNLFCISSYEIEKFARNTGLKLFRTSVKENLNVSKVFHYLGERHVEAVSRSVQGGVIRPKKGQHLEGNDR